MTNSQTRTQAMRSRRMAGGAVILALALGSAVAPAAAGARTNAVPSGPRIAVRTEWANVLAAEWAGPWTKVCHQLTGKGRQAYTHGASCKKTFSTNQKSLRRKIAITSWLVQVKLAADRVRLRFTTDRHGVRHVTVTDPLKKFSRAQLVKDGGHWLFASAPPRPL